MSAPHEHEPQPPHRPGSAPDPADPADTPSGHSPDVPGRPRFTPAQRQPRHQQVVRGPDSQRGNRHGAAATVHRWQAFGIDVGVTIGILAIGWVLIMLTGAAISMAIGDEEGDVMLVAAAVALVLLGSAAFCCYWLPVAKYGQTLGKRIARIKVVDAATGAAPSPGKAAWRAVVMAALALPCFLGLVISLLLVLRDGENRRGIQDTAAGTRVVSAGRA